MKKLKLIALFAALIAGICTYQLLKEISKPVEIPRTPVVVAAVDIPENTLISADMVMLSPIANESLLEHHMRELDSVVGKVISSDVYAGEQIVSDRLVRIGESDDTHNTLAYHVTDGMRAVTISVNSVTGLANMIKPGNHLDAVLTWSYTDTASKDSAKQDSRLLLQDLNVLAVNAELGKNGLAEYGTITLETTPEDAVLLIEAGSNGSIDFIMRSPLDEEIVDPIVIDADFIREATDTEEGGPK